MPQSDRRSRRLLIVIIAAAFALRLFVALGAVPVLHADSDEYHHYAANLVRDHAYYFDYQGPIAAWRGLRFRSSRPPGYPFFIAAIYFFTGPSPGPCSSPRPCSTLSPC